MFRFTTRAGLYFQARHEIGEYELVSLPFVSTA